MKFIDEDNINIKFLNMHVFFYKNKKYNANRIILNNWIIHISKINTRILNKSLGN